MKAVLLIFLLATGVSACVKLKERHDLEERAATAARTLRIIYVLTPYQRLGIVHRIGQPV